MIGRKLMLTHAAMMAGAVGSSSNSGDILVEESPAPSPPEDYREFKRSPDLKRPYACGECDRNFATQSGRASHMANYHNA